MKSTIMKRRCTGIVFVLLAAAWVEVSLGSDATLRELAAPRGIYVGAAANANHLASDAAYAKLLGEQYSLATAENGCKFGPTEPGEGVFDYDSCDAVLNATRNARMAFRGHNFVWGNNNPNWLLQKGSNGTALKSAMLDHIAHVAKHYNDDACCWDVVNEAISDSNTGDVLKSNTWYPAVPNYVDVAFRAARSAAGENVKLFINDYSVASSESWSKGKSDRLYEYVKKLKLSGTPIDGVGLQLHVKTDYNASGVAANLRRYHDLGLIVHMTEIDVSSKGSWTAEEEELQAQVYAALLQICLDSAACKSFETWGFTDKYTWKGLEAHPLPFDENLKPKKAFFALADVLGGNKTWVKRYWMRVMRQ